MDYLPERVTLLADEVVGGRVTSEHGNRPTTVDEQTLATRVRRGILRLAAGRIRELSVEVHGNTIQIRGRCSSFYCKQLAQHAAMELATGQQVDNQLHVA